MLAVLHCAPRHEVLVCKPAACEHTTASTACVTHFRLCVRWHHRGVYMMQAQFRADGAAWCTARDAAKSDPRPVERSRCSALPQKVILLPDIPAVTCTATSCCLDTLVTFSSSAVQSSYFCLVCVSVACIAPSSCLDNDTGTFALHGSLQHKFAKVLACLRLPDACTEVGSECNIMQSFRAFAVCFMQLSCLSYICSDKGTSLHAHHHKRSPCTLSLSDCMQVCNCTRFQKHQQSADVCSVG